MDIIAEDIKTIKHDLEKFSDKIKNKSFLVTGGAGFLGSWFCDVLNSFSAKIICIDSLSSGSRKNIMHLEKNDNFKFIEADVLDFKTDEKIDYIVHMASIASPTLYQKYPIETLNANVLGTKNMLELAKIKKIKGFLFTSTSEIYGFADVIPTPETYWGNVNPVGTRSMYDEGKRVAETFCIYYFKEFKVPVRIARIFNTYGPRLDFKLTSEYGRVVIKFIYQAANRLNLTVYGDGSQTRSFCYITDQIIGLFKFLLMPNLDGEIINIGNDEETKILDLAKKIINLTGTNSKITFESLPKDDPRRRCPDISKAKKLLGYTPRIGLEEGLKRTIAWYKQTLAKSSS